MSFCLKSTLLIIPCLSPELRILSLNDIDDILFPWTFLELIIRFLSKSKILNLPNESPIANMLAFPLILEMYEFLELKIEITSFVSVL
ncbi:hypothetical protein HERIO_473 [Hepatospora eriocheir]|uniref:Uncharacterized protein n=1 Tax=Hepatospora eriocheir TaxID=1081669 RepID=A0A1X0QD54_9MICR|nr:hypothetical protein HERIO_473 [Hepatospora eriocheir]